MDGTTFMFQTVLPALLGLVIAPVTMGICRSLGIYAVVKECESQVFTLFGRVLGTIDDPGLRFPLLRFGPKAILIPFFGKRHVVDTKLRQHYLRGQMINSEEGTPMGVGIWYEMQVNDPVAYLFANTNPEGSLEAERCQFHDFHAQQPRNGQDARGPP